MNWSNTVATVLIVVVFLISFAGASVGVAILWEIYRKNVWKLAEPAVIKSRWRMVRPWMLGGAVLGLLVGISITLLLDLGQEKIPVAPPDITTTTPDEIKPRPRDGGQPAE